ncbi:hypothetical protein OK016_27585 [Vibrio chagasii]|nr:hypothetical protein [Vibrio chagasii]
MGHIELHLSDYQPVSAHFDTVVLSVAPSPLSKFGLPSLIVLLFGLFDFYQRHEFTADENDQARGQSIYYC